MEFSSNSSLFVILIIRGQHVHVSNVFAADHSGSIGFKRIHMRSQRHHKGHNGGEAREGLLAV